MNIELGICPVCGGTLSTSAGICPHCGHGNKRSAVVGRVRAFDDVPKYSTRGTIAALATLSYIEGREPDAKYLEEVGRRLGNDNVDVREVMAEAKAILDEIQGKDADMTPGEVARLVEKTIRARHPEDWERGAGKQKCTQETRGAARVALTKTWSVLWRIVVFLLGWVALFIPGFFLIALLVGVTGHDARLGIVLQCVAVIYSMGALRGVLNMGKKLFGVRVAWWLGWVLIAISCLFALLGILSGIRMIILLASNAVSPGEMEVGGLLSWFVLVVALPLTLLGKVRDFRKEIQSAQLVANKGTAVAHDTVKKSAEDASFPESPAPNSKL